MSNILKKTVLLLTVAVFAAFGANAQEKYAREYEQQGDKAMQKQQYMQAYEYYKLGRKFVKQNLSLMYKCGEACLQMKDYDKAEYWYQKVIIENDTVDINNTYPYLYLHLAQSAVCNGNIIQAQSFLNTCLLDCNDIEIRKACKKELERIDWIIDNDTKTDYVITNLGKNVNDASSQLNTFILNDSLMIYTSPVYKTKVHKGQTYYTDIYNQLYCSFVDGDYYTPGKPLMWGEINKKKTDCGDLFFDTNTFTAYFTYSKIKNNKKTTAIYYSAFNSSTNKWSKPQIYKPLEDDKHSYSHPVTVKQGNQYLMYFASDREGGYGNMDIWYIDMNLADVKPVNLGAEINTAGNEITPFYFAKDSTLYFASDTHLGFGGFDIFKSKGFASSWQKPQNLMMPINSPANDMYPFIATCECEGYFTSNRPTENNEDNKTCCNDLYRFNYVPPAKPYVPVAVQQPAKPKFDMLTQLPVALYFHNDSPDAGSELPTTQTSYQDCYKLYISLTNQYKANRTKGMDDSSAAARLAEIDEFMNGKVKQGLEKLNAALDFIYDNLQQGKHITIQIKGYCSSLSSTQYNHRLAQRRIASVENYMRSYRGGILALYMDTQAQDGKPMLETEHLAIGKLQSTSPDPEELEAKRSSVYLPSSMQERRIEIQEIHVRN